ncbi:MarR family winged helix-turn-helix transcriptional regulator [Cohnella sp. AR92]|uniref:MarR family winged helix-turn-helix transcriptional regulator n=1 Tax=Cohnella sp. AR92 TaxID=648716 RepID=UPI000F8C9A3A|nr:MarR family transcriptional regulator [Cohnella sp. AR92]RUS47399.1 MarR family transcriptional regulator [Cohnella sp. AR92]
MSEQTIFEILHNMDKVTNTLIVQWSKLFNEDLGITHILVLGHLKNNGNSRPSDIARALELTPPTLTHLSDKLVKKKLAVRIVDESDRRIIYLAITSKGVEVVQKANEDGQMLRRKLFEILTEEEREQMSAIYKKLSNAL